VKLIDCDSSDMAMWLSTPMAANVVREVTEWRDSADKVVHAKLSERAAGQYEMAERLLRIFKSYN
jgi:hypothetical protein